MDEKDSPQEIFIVSLISSRTQKPRIEIKLGDVRTQMSADAAMKVARDIMEVAQGAYADAFLYHFLNEELKQAPDVCGTILHEFRIYRDTLAQEFKAEQEVG